MRALLPHCLTGWWQWRQSEMGKDSGSEWQRGWQWQSLHAGIPPDQVEFPTKTTP